MLRVRRKYNMGEEYTLEKLEVYQLSKELSSISWNIYESFNWQTRKIIGDQFITSTDSSGANIVEGYGRFHYLDRVKFLYNARGSLLESKYWLDLLVERKILKDKKLIEDYNKIYIKLKPKLNNFINSIYKNRTPNP